MPIIIIKLSDIGTGLDIIEVVRKNDQVEKALIF
jgi:hypothetical protein